MILVTGGCGFIGSNIVQALNDKGICDIIVSDRLGSSPKWRNLADKQIADYIDKDSLFQSIAGRDIKTVIHMGAITDSMEKNAKRMLDENFEFSKEIWRFCTDNQIRLIYASSASVYGDGRAGFSDHDDPNCMVPLSLYAYSKLLFDRWVLGQTKAPSAWAGMRFFNVYGPGEWYKGGMASMVYHAYHQIRKHGKVKLFKSGRMNYEHGEQKRDFVYVKDVANVALYLCQNPSPISGIYNVGSGNKHTFNELVHAVFASLKLPVHIEYFDMPEGLEQQYQYDTLADISKLRKIGYSGKFTALERGVSEYVQYLNEAHIVHGGTVRCE